MSANASCKEVKNSMIELLPAAAPPTFRYVYVTPQQGMLLNTATANVADCISPSHKQMEYFLHAEQNATHASIMYAKEQTPIELNVIKGIISFQSEYFVNGNIKSLKVMRLKDIADLTGLHLSTVAKVVRNKTIKTPFATISLKELFSEGIWNLNGELISNRVIQNEIKEIIKSEGKLKPNSDQKISELLQTRGYNIARRTVSKYREILNIPVSYSRHIERFS